MEYKCFRVYRCASRWLDKIASIRLRNSLPGLPLGFSFLFSLFPSSPLTTTIPTIASSSTMPPSDPDSYESSDSSISVHQPLAIPNLGHIPLPDILPLTQFNRADHNSPFQGQIMYSQ